MGSDSEHSDADSSPSPSVVGELDARRPVFFAPVASDSTNLETSLSDVVNQEAPLNNETDNTNLEPELPDDLIAIRLKALAKKKITLRRDILGLSHQSLKAFIRDDSQKLYGDEPKDAQVEAVAALVHGHHTFVLAGTGFGKTRIAEMYHNLFQPYQKSIVVVLNPLDSLGDNQVDEKGSVGVEHKKLSAINLTQDVLDDALAKRIISGAFEFVYLSPEALLNNRIFRGVWFNPMFQSRLSLVVVDEAHMIYEWGLVANGQSKSLSSHARHRSERGIFRPSYGNLCERLMATNGTPLLMMSATCRPIAIEKIIGSLKLYMGKVEFIRAELTRPEIWIVRINMKKSISSSEDLADLYATQEQTPDCKIVPTLIYSTTRNLTETVLDVVNRACNPIKTNNAAFSTFARRYHSQTGKFDQPDIVNSFASGVFPVVSATMALGLGQNWKRVRLGYIPMSVDDPNYKREVERENEKGFPTCICSNCEPESSQWLIENFKRMTTENFDSIISESPTNIASLNPPSEVCITEKDEVVWVKESGEKPLGEILEAFMQELVKKFENLFYNQMKEYSAYPPSVYFGIKQARKIAKNVTILTWDNIEQLIGHEMIPGQMEMLVKDAETFRSGDIYQNFVQIQQNRSAEIERNAYRLRQEKEAEESKKLEARKITQEDAARKKIETSLRVAANSERNKSSSADDPGRRKAAGFN
ncbi:hypothetical protein PCASD_04321 [Puccinia coronata f. sp. avenae]|uniref:DNA 3'-5' helicase n=1 Tax=Puccinia coronata f. sp. avenae TaxID=200324 RepID=A0A2N5VCW6_9BASI|nr:hypothetical protein PCASD_04321 [Puccinia coronata f. sp. avenae]